MHRKAGGPNSLLSLYRKLIYIRNNHAALRVGDFYLVDTGNRAVFANLSVSRNETVLIIINLSSELISDYGLNLEQGPLSGDYVLAPLLDNGQFTLPAITDQGGFENYPAFAHLQAHSTSLRCRSPYRSSSSLRSTCHMLYIGIGIQLFHCTSPDHWHLFSFAINIAVTVLPHASINDGGIPGSTASNGHDTVTGPTLAGTFNKPPL